MAKQKSSQHRQRPTNTSLSRNCNSGIAFGHYRCPIFEDHGEKKARQEKLDEAMVNSAFSEEDERRTAWIDYYVANGQLTKQRH